MTLTPAGLDPVKPQVLHPRLALPTVNSVPDLSEILDLWGQFPELRACHPFLPRETVSNGIPRFIDVGRGGLRLTLYKPTVRLHLSRSGFLE